MKRIGDATIRQSWNSWLYSLVSNLQIYVQFKLLCGYSLPAISTLFYLILKTILSFYELFHDFTISLFIFKVILYCSLYGFMALKTHFELREKLLLSYWLSRTTADGMVFSYIFTHLKFSSSS